jgi:hypothetical protein
MHLLACIQVVEKHVFAHVQAKRDVGADEDAEDEPGIGAWEVRLGIGVPGQGYAERNGDIYVNHPPVEYG